MALEDILRIALVCLLLQKTSLRSSTVASAQRPSDLIKDPIVYYTTTELACSEGYSVQEHKVVTDDGYVLTVHRIPNGRNRPKVPHNRNQYHKIHLGHHPDFDECMKESFNQTSKGFPLLFVHGIAIASDWWLLQGPGYDLAYIMADNGYDVWMVNIRGNFYSRKHVRLSPSDPKFWDFSFHENAMFDVPATIDYILKVTKRDKLGYIGFSMGTTMFFAMTSLRPEYNEKIIGAVALAPVAFEKNEYMTPIRKTLMIFLERLLEELTKRDVHELFPRLAELIYLASNFCSKGSQLQDICYYLISIPNGNLVLRNKLHLYLSHMPSGTTLKTFTHFLQNMKRSTFKLFDYGIEKNVELYGAPTPPDYPLWRITTPVALYYTDGDFYYDARDIEDLWKELPNVVDIDKKHEYGHSDYLWSFTAKDTVYPKAVSLFKKLTDQYYIQTRRKKSTTTEKNFL